MLLSLEPSITQKLTVQHKKTENLLLKNNMDNFNIKCYN